MTNTTIAAAGAAVPALALDSSNDVSDVVIDQARLRTRARPPRTLPHPMTDPATSTSPAVDHDEADDLRVQDLHRHVGDHDDGAGRSPPAMASAFGAAAAASEDGFTQKSGGRRIAHISGLCHGANPYRQARPTRISVPELCTLHPLRRFRPATTAASPVSSLSLCAEAVAESRPVARAGARRVGGATTPPLNHGPHPRWSRTTGTPCKLTQPDRVDGDR